MTPFTTLTSAAAVVRVADIDTDQIIPARFLKGTSRTGLGVHLFADRPDFALDPGAQILIAGANFGCGSSREHAPWALVDRGFRAVIAPSFAGIFPENATTNGLLTVAVDVELDRTSIHIDLAAQTVNGHRFEIDAFAKHCLLSGLDELEYILSFDDRIAAYEHR